MTVKVRDLKGDGAAWLVIHHQGTRTTEKIGDWTLAYIRAAEAEAKLAEPEQRTAPTFADFAQRYLREDTAYLADTTTRDRELHINGRFGKWWGEKRVNEISRAELRRWWAEEIEARELSAKTGMNQLDTLIAVLRFGAEAEPPLADVAPAREYRRGLVRRLRATKGGRAIAEPQVAPIEQPKRVLEIVQWAESTKRWDDGAAVLIALFGALRSGEVAGLSWPDVWWGRDDDDMTRHLFIRESLPRGGDASEAKSGRARRVAMPRRLRGLLRSRWIELGQPAEGRVVPSFEPTTAVHRLGRLFGCRVKDLRDTYACHLLSLGVPLGWISRQLGHANAAITARHYARFVDPEGGVWRPAVPRDGEVLSDLLERVLEQAALDGTRDVTSERRASRAKRRKPAKSFGGPPGTRTQNQRVKSPLLYRLS